jgi:HemX protein
VDWLTDRRFFLCAVIIYGVATLYSLFLWRRGFRKADHVSYLLLLLGFLFHTTAMALRGLRYHQCPVQNLHEATVFVAWSVVGAYLVIGLWPRVRFFSAFASPVLFAVGVFALMPGLDRAHGVQIDPAEGWKSLHAALILIAYGAFGLASVSALMYLTQEHDLKFHKLRAIFSLLPPIQRLEVITNRLVSVGFVLLTFGLAIGGHMPRPQGVVYIKDPKVLWSAVLWLLYFALLLSRWRFAWVGRRFACGAIGVFAFVLLTFWGFNLLSPIHSR